MPVSQQDTAAPVKKLTLMERLERYSRKSVQIECEKFSRNTEEWDLSVSGRLAEAAKLCEAVREHLERLPSAPGPGDRTNDSASGRSE